VLQESKQDQICVAVGDVAAHYIDSHRLPKYQRDEEGTLTWGAYKVNCTADMLVFGLLDEPIPVADSSSLSTSALGPVIAGNIFLQNHTSANMHFELVALNF